MSAEPFPSFFVPDERQAAVLAHRSGPMVVTGAAGTGKTAILVERLAALIEAGADPERTVLIVRTGRASRSLRATLLGRLGRSLAGLRVTTVHGMANDVLGRRFEALGFDRAPDVLNAGDQFARVSAMLAQDDASRWPAFGPMVKLRGFADVVRQFLLRAQERLVAPHEVAERASASGLQGWAELAAFYQRYLDELARHALVDYAGLVVRAGEASAEAEPIFDHLMVDDYQEATPAAERLLIELRPASLVVAGDRASHVFSFQGTTDAPLERFERRFSGAHAVELEVPHRFARGGPVARAWTAAHTSEEQSAIARELRRVHVQEHVAWEDMAVVVRRHGDHLGGLLRALDDAGVPRATPDRTLSLVAEPAAFPYVLALRWLARPEERNGLVEALLTSDLARLSPAAARGLVRAAVAAGGEPADALSGDGGLSDAEARALDGLRAALDHAAGVADRSALDAFATLWRELPSSRRLVESGTTQAGRRDLDAVVALSEAIARAAERGELPAAAFLDLLEAGDRGPGLDLGFDDTGPGVRVLTAHGTAGDEFDTVVIADAVEGNFPSVSRSEPMFDLALLERPVSQSERNRLRLEDERRLFTLILRRARRSVLITAGDPHGAETNLSIRSRFVAEQGLAWTPAPSAPYPDPLTVAEAHATWRHVLADPAASPADRLAALGGIQALGVDPASWWYQRDWTGDDRPLHEELRVSHSRLEKLENCNLQYVLGQEIGLEGRAGYHAWVGSLVHELIDECDRGTIERSEAALIAEAERRWRREPFPSLAVSEAFRRLVTEVALPAWVREYGQAPALAHELRFEFAFDGALVVGVIDRIGGVSPVGTQITDYKTGKSRNAAPAGENLQLGIYYLAVQRDEDLKAFRPVRCVELAFLRDQERDGSVARTVRAFTGAREEEFESAMAARLAGLIDRLRELQRTENYRPNPAAACRFCDFKTLCPLWPEGRPLFPEPRASLPLVEVAT